MAEITPGGDREAQEATVESLQAVVDRVQAWQTGAPVETVRTELVAALGKAGASAPAAWIDEVARKISDEQQVSVELP